MVNVFTIYSEGINILQNKHLQYIHTNTHPNVIQYFYEPPMLAEFTSLS